MKKILMILTLFTVLIGCRNQDIEFPDFEYTSGYFPYQYPVRTLVLGDYIYDNTNDNNHTFLISVAMGGVYENKKSRTFTFALAEDLCNNVLFTSTKDTIRVMPRNYYTLASADKITIPSGKVNGGVEVKLNDAFFNDPLSIKLGYVVPLRLVSSADVDTILQGKTSKINPDPRVANQWDIAPKDFTMFAVKYINPYHGKYLHRGVSTVKDAGNTQVEQTVYRKQYVVDDEIWSLVTKSMTEVTLTGTIRSALITGTFSMLLTISANGTVSVKEAEGSPMVITGSGKFVNDGDEWGNKKRDAIHLNYQFVSGTHTYSAVDTLVIRDRAVVMEVYTPTVFTK